MNERTDECQTDDKKGRHKQTRGETDRSVKNKRKRTNGQARKQTDRQTDRQTDLWIDGPTEVDPEYLSRRMNLMQPGR